MPIELSDRLQRAHQSLIGLAVGDALGAFFEFSHGRLSRRVSEQIKYSSISVDAEDLVSLGPGAAG